MFSSAEASIFHYVENKEYDVLLLDIEMGNMDGVTLARQIRKSNKNVQIVFITGYSDYIAEGYDVEALHYLMKPLKDEKLFDVLDRAVNKLVQNEKHLVLNTLAVGSVYIYYDEEYKSLFCDSTDLVFNEEEFLKILNEYLKD